MIENKVKTKIVIIKAYEFLPCNKVKFLSGVKQKILQIVDEGLLKLRLAQSGIIFQIQKFEHIRVFDKLLGSKPRHILIRFRNNAVLFPTCKEPFIIMRIDLSFELPA